MHPESGWRRSTNLGFLTIFQFVIQDLRSRFASLQSLWWWWIAGSLVTGIPFCERQLVSICFHSLDFTICSMTSDMQYAFDNLGNDWKLPNHEFEIKQARNDFRLTDTINWRAPAETDHRSQRTQVTKETDQPNSVLFAFGMRIPINTQRANAQNRKGCNFGCRFKARRLFYTCRWTWR